MSERSPIYFPNDERGVGFVILSTEISPKLLSGLILIPEVVLNYREPSTGEVVPAKICQWHCALRHMNLTEQVHNDSEPKSGGEN